MIESSDPFDSFSDGTAVDLARARATQAFPKIMDTYRPSDITTTLLVLLRSSLDIVNG
jgi:hypothetical protein